MIKQTEGNAIIQIHNTEGTAIATMQQ